MFHCFVRVLGDGIFLQVEVSMSLVATVTFDRC